MKSLTLLAIAEATPRPAFVPQSASDIGAGFEDLNMALWRANYPGTSPLIPMTRAQIAAVYPYWPKK